MKDIKFLDDMVEKIYDDVDKGDEKDILRPDGNPNKIIENFQKWENFYKYHKEELKDQANDSHLNERNTIQNSKLFF